jgi:hypothetical protein
LGFKGVLFLLRGILLLMGVDRGASVPQTTAQEITSTEKLQPTRDRWTSNEPERLAQLWQKRTQSRPGLGCAIRGGLEISVPAVEELREIRVVKLPGQPKAAEGTDNCRMGDHGL